MDERESRTLLALALAVLALLLLLTAWRGRPPRPVEPGADESRFPAWRAKQTLDSFLGQSEPHPIGSAENENLRDNILFRLREIGYEPDVQERFVCNTYASCGKVHNIVARLRGSESGKAVLVAVHYDSVPAGPGASDDGVGVAIVLEIARILRAGTPPKNDVIFLIGDGEEAGLLGAEAFVQGHPWAGEVGAVVNLEARGSSGLSYLFETAAGNAWIVDQLAALRRPATSSVFYEIYRRLPNDTDFTVFKRTGLQGVNFAFIGDVAHYHTPLDNVENASLESIQHQGDNALSMVTLFSNIDLVAPPPGNAVWFDLYGFGIVKWPERWTLPLVILNAVLFVGLVWLFRARSRLDIRRFLMALAGWLVSVIATVAIAFGLFALLRLAGGYSSAWIAHPTPALLGFWLIAFVVPLLVMSWFTRPGELHACWAAAVAWLVALSIASTLITPGATHLVLTGALAAVLAGILVGAAKRERPWHDAVLILSPLIGCGIVLLPMAWTLYDAMGLPLVAQAVVVAIAIVFSFVVPVALLAIQWRRRLLLWVLACSVLLLIVGALLPPYSERSPQRLNILLIEDADQHTARWAVSRKPPEPMQTLVDWNREPFDPFPWYTGSRSYRTAPAEYRGISAPEIIMLEESATEDGRTLTIRYQPRRIADRALILFGESDLERLVVDGHTLPSGTSMREWLRPGWSRVRLATVPREGVVIELRVPHLEPLQVIVQEESFGVPREPVDLPGARPATAVPSDSGDLTIVQKTFSL